VEIVYQRIRITVISSPVILSLPVGKEKNLRVSLSTGPAENA